MTAEQETIVRYRLQRARETMQEAEGLAALGLWNGAANRLYYACFYAVSALLLRHGHSFTRHTTARAPGP